MDYFDDVHDSIDSTQFDWIDGSYLRIDPCSNTSISIKANKEGLLSLADQLIRLANCIETSIIYQTWPGDLEEGSLELEICRVNHIGRKSYKTGDGSMS